MIKPYITITNRHTLYFYPGYDVSVGQLYNSNLHISQNTNIHSPTTYSDNSVEYIIDVASPRWHDVTLKSLQPDFVSDLKFKIYF